MRVVVLLCLLTIPMMTLGWPSPWIVVVAAFVAGFLARRPPAPPPTERRPGYIDVSHLDVPGSPLAERIGLYTGPAPLDPQAFGIQLERPEYGDCEGCGGR